MPTKITTPAKNPNTQGEPFTDLDDLRVDNVINARDKGRVYNTYKPDRFPYLEEGDKDKGGIWLIPYKLRIKQDKILKVNLPGQTSTMLDDVKAHLGEATILALDSLRKKNKIPTDSAQLQSWVTEMKERTYLLTLIAILTSMRAPIAQNINSAYNIFVQNQRSGKYPALNRLGSHAQTKDFKTNPNSMSPSHIMTSKDVNRINDLSRYEAYLLNTDQQGNSINDKGEVITLTLDEKENLQTIKNVLERLNVAPKGGALNLAREGRENYAYMIRQIYGTETEFNQTLYAYQYMGYKGVEQLRNRDSHAFIQKLDALFKKIAAKSDTAADRAEYLALIGRVKDINTHAAPKSRTTSGGIGEYGVAQMVNMITNEARRILKTEEPKIAKALSEPIADIVGNIFDRYGKKITTDVTSPMQTKSLTEALNKISKKKYKIRVNVNKGSKPIRQRSEKLTQLSKNMRDSGASKENIDLMLQEYMKILNEMDKDIDDRLNISVKTSMSAGSEIRGIGTYGNLVNKMTLNGMVNTDVRTKQFLFYNYALNKNFMSTVDREDGGTKQSRELQDMSYSYISLHKGNSSVYATKQDSETSQSYAARLQLQIIKKALIDSTVQTIVNKAVSAYINNEMKVTGLVAKEYGVPSEIMMLAYEYRLLTELKNQGRIKMKSIHGNRLKQISGVLDAYTNTVDNDLSKLMVNIGHATINNLFKSGCRIYKLYTKNAVADAKNKIDSLLGMFDQYYSDALNNYYKRVKNLKTKKTELKGSLDFVISIQKAASNAMERFQTTFGNYYQLIDMVEDLQVTIKTKRYNE